jgi:hexosaminidase
MWSLSRDTIVDIWKDSRDARAVLDRGYKIVHAPADYFYLVSGASLTASGLFCEGQNKC